MLQCILLLGLSAYQFNWKLQCIYNFKYIGRARELPSLALQCFLCEPPYEHFETRRLRNQEPQRCYTKTQQSKESKTAKDLTNKG